ncbi:hypothetical protein [Chondrinema litorale]|uniref:hypothetical protein n=1 Tax=Chondrinema litorale TaxID=2994555 RepID=UPI002542EC79|nr:hypothetical protein [Chondrinema litorale]UZR96393.1 hypothetical protein OQ292_22310 [Chondrinema litorale]
MTTFIYGVIEEYGLNHRRLEEIYPHNEKIISSLSTSNSWPPLSKEMFSITKNDKEIKLYNLEYWGRMIHFAACLKSVEYDWLEWKKKIENLLQRKALHSLCSNYLFPLLVTISNQLLPVFELLSKY